MIGAWTSAGDRFWGSLEREHPRWVSWTLGTLMAVTLVGFLAYLGLRDHQAVQRCEARGGVTWDAGEHCVLGDPEIVNSR